MANTVYCKYDLKEAIDVKNGAFEKCFINIITSVAGSRAADLENSTPKITLIKNNQEQSDR